MTMSRLCGGSWS